MRTTQADIGARDRSHAYEVKGSGEECSEGRGKRNLMSHAHRYRCSHQLLFGNEHLKVAIGMSLGKFFGKGRVAYLAIHPNHIRVGIAERLQRIAVGLARGNGVFTVILRQLQRLLRRLRGGLAILRLMHRENLAAYRVKLLERLLFLLLIERFAMPAIDILQEGDTFALDGLGNNRSRRAIWLHRLSIRLVYLIIVVPIN